MKVKAVRCHFDEHGADVGLEKALNKIGYENVLQVLPMYCGGEEYFYTIIYKESEAEAALKEQEARP